MEIFFPVSELSLNPFFPIVIGFVLAFFCSMGGISGAFLLLPVQMSFLGFTSPSVSATNQLYNIVAIPSGVWRFYKEGRLIPPLVKAVVIGTLPGVFIGAIIRVYYMPDPDLFKLFVGCVLLYIGIRMLRDLLAKKQASTGGGAQGSGRVEVLPSGFFEVRFIFREKEYHVGAAGIMALSGIVGIIGGIYGIGGGAIIAPFFVSVFGLPVYTVAGAALMGTFITSVAGVIFYQILALMNPEQAISPDWLLGILFGIGGFIGMYLGARTQKFVPERWIKWGLCLVIAWTAGNYILGYFF
ncbi:sulfite exporter TauE/SafE family protein [Desulfobotulus mexicanus]|uniref:sulfite exporter TauE/SafE family protein n=1 Tax=Desulfobotulus mexicanus TaxID=2586642 RepID=UPI002482E610|nr:sulfite exporter TauE/SafE family protein [Desulfobotulus mexicanus]